MRSRPDAVRAASSIAICFLSLAEPESRISISAGHSAAGISDCEKNSCSSDSSVSVGAMPKLADSSAMALSTLPARAIQADSASRLRMASPITSLKVWSAETTMAVASALPSALSGCVDASSSTCSVSWSSNCVVEASSSTVKRAATLASNGNWCSSRVQKAWMVCTFSPPGVSSAEANSLRARARWPASAFLPVLSRILLSSASSSSVVHSASVPNTRFAMLAAAALVKVMQRILAGSTPRSSRLMTRCASTWVLPEPALAATNADTSGSAASTCTRLTSGGMMRGALMPRPHRRRRTATIP